MNLIGQSIQHKAFGNGVIIDLTDNIITICFSKGEKKFIYPDAFSSYLTLKDNSMQSTIHKILRKKKKAENAKKQEIQQERERIERINKLKITPNSHAAFNISADRKNLVFSSWTLSTGCYLSGNSKGKPRIPNRLKPNSLCILTECTNEMKENDRRIIGVSMVKDNFYGKLCKDGLIESHPLYRIALKEEESLPFWSYIKAETPQRWGNIVFKYFSNESMQQILSDISISLNKPKEKELANEFYQYFCKINRLPTTKAANNE